MKRMMWRGTNIMTDTASWSRTIEHQKPSTNHLSRQSWGANTPPGRESAWRHCAHQAVALSGIGRGIAVNLSSCCQKPYHSPLSARGPRYTSQQITTFRKMKRIL